MCGIFRMCGVFTICGIIRMYGVFWGVVCGVARGAWDACGVCGRVILRVMFVNLFFSLRCLWCL